MRRQLLVGISILSFLGGLKAQDTGPHGGRIKAVKDYKIEAVGCDNYIEVYLFNHESEPVFNNGIDGNITFFYDKNSVKAALVKYGLDGYTARISSPDFSHYTITFIVENKSLTADFTECVVPKP